MKQTHIDRPSHREPLSRAEVKVLLLTCPCHFLTHLFILVFPAVTIPILNSLGMPLEDVISLGFLMYLLYGLGALPAGYLADRWQARKLLILGILLMGSGLLLAGLFPSARTIPPCLALVGLGASIYHPAGLALITHAVKRRGYALAINGVWGNLGIATAPFVAGILTWLLSWQQAFIVLGAGAALTGAILSFIRVDESPHPVSHRPADGGNSYTRYFLILCFALIMGGLAYRGNTVLLPAYLELKTTFFNDFIHRFSFVQLQGTRTLAATILTSLVFLVGIFGQMLGGKLADRYDLRYAYLAIHAAAVPFLLGMAFTTNYLLAFCAAGYVLFSLGMQPVENSLVAALTPARWRGTGFAIKFVLTFGIGSTAVYLIAAVKSRFSLEAAYITLAGIAFLLVSSIIVLIIASRKVRDIRN